MTPHLIAATTLTTTLTIITVRYLALCWVEPFRACRTCHGRGRLPTGFGRSTRTCRRCRGTGLRLRLGRHAINHYRRIHADAHRPTHTTDPTRTPAGTPWR